MQCSYLGEQENSSALFEIEALRYIESNVRKSRKNSVQKNSEYDTTLRKKYPDVRAVQLLVIPIFCN